MAHASLATHYRPQTFNQVTGQEMITTVLSRACAEESIAPAYLFSGTRGVGKTTIARIFAKALNCAKAPTGEPCNACDQCHKITQGNHVDVTEIDGASNNSVEDARALREHIGYAAMEGRYKVFIIDEAHMLSRNAFNALLKTLEEPPPRVVFIFATTEVHKFPITIVSRCQHFILKRLSEQALIGHLSYVLKQEGVEHEDSALRLIARRAAGSVRDGMSLLGQSLALGEKILSLETTRRVLGLAGQEFFATLIQGIAKNDCASIVQFSQDLGEQGIDIGFFLRELTSLWRTLFLLREAGNSILPSLGLSDDDAKLWLSMAPLFSSAHLHAAWHMTLDAQRKIIHSPEPAAALELLLLNLALMPRLLPLHKMEGVEPPKMAQPRVEAPTPAARPMATSPAPHTTEQHIKAEPRAKSEQKPENIENNEAEPEPAPKANIVRTPEPECITDPEFIPEPDFMPMHEQDLMPEVKVNNIQTVPSTQAKQVSISKEQTVQPLQMVNGQASAELASTEQATAQTANPSWEDFQKLIIGIVPSDVMHQLTGSFNGQTLELQILSSIAREKLEQVKPHLISLCKAHYGFMPLINIEKTIKEHKAESVLIQEFSAREELQNCLEILDASITRVSAIHKGEIK